MPLAPSHSAFVSPNVSFVRLFLNKWDDSGCPISHFVIQYKPFKQNVWILHSNHILPEQEVVTITDLVPGTWYNLLVTAENEVGTTETEYQFATLTITGATIAPLAISESRYQSFFDDPIIIIPALSALVVLITIGATIAYIILWKIKGVQEMNEIG